MVRVNSKPKSQSQRAVEAIRELITSNKLPAGSTHLETELAERLGMSRTPVREASLVLEAQGLLQVRPRKGVQILAISASDMADIYDILTELESLAAANAAGAGYDDDDLAELEKAIQDMEMALEADDLEKWAMADDDFHAELVRIGRNDRAASIVEMMIHQVRRARTTTLYMRPKPTHSNNAHRGVLQAIRDGDANTARDIHRAHRQSSKEMIISLLERHKLHLL